MKVSDGQFDILKTLYFISAKSDVKMAKPKEVADKLERSDNVIRVELQRLKEKKLVESPFPSGWRVTRKGYIVLQKRGAVI